MTFSDITFRGPSLFDCPLLNRLPHGYAKLLREVNGFIAFDGGFHLRGICDEPAWHSLNKALEGEQAIHALFPAVQASDIPFAQDCIGDQFILRKGVIHRLSRESGEIESMDLSWVEFFTAMEADPFEFLEMHPLLQFQREGGELQPGQLLSAWPPFVTKEAARGVSLRAIPTAERISFLADFARQLASIRDGEQVRIRWVE